LYFHFFKASEVPVSSGQRSSRRRKSSQKIITSDHRGFAGVRPPKKELNSGQHSLVEVELFYAVLSSEEHHAHRSWRMAPGGIQSAVLLLPLLAVD
jgi:hypothetical protein